ncbi:hypothetical protein D3C77_458300 [compost metagenome]
MPMSEGTTIIQKRLIIIAAASSCTSAPMSKDRTPGTINGASSVSMRIIDKVKAIFPLYMLTQTKLVTPVGMLEASTRPVIM